MQISLSKTWEIPTKISFGEKDASKGQPIRVFDSQKEFSRWEELKLMERAGAISGLSRQIPLLIQDGLKYRNERIRKIEYIADFTYFQNGEQVIEDTKPFDVQKQKYLLTKDFSLKWKLLKGKYPNYLFVIH